MNDRHTPETNAEVGYFDLETAVSADFARRLERERDEAREESQRLRVQLNHFWQANEMAEQAFRERDEAHKIAEKAIDDLAWFNETNAKSLGNELKQLKEETREQYKP